MDGLTGGDIYQKAAELGPHMVSDHDEATYRHK